MNNIGKIFESAHLKFTAWFVAGMMTISILFSFIIYENSLAEFRNRFDNIQSGIAQKIDRDVVFLNLGLGKIREEQAREASKNILIMLIYMNILIGAIAAITGYYWSRKTLDPIEKIHKSQSQFTSDVSHEFKTPLAVIKAETEFVLSDENATTQEMRETLKSNLEEVERLTVLSSALLKLSNLDTNSLKFSNIKLKDLTQAAINTFSKAEQNRIKIDSKTDLFVNGNRETLQELLIILLDNALKYSQPKTPITVKIKNQHFDAVISVINIGPKITPAEQTKIFERFYRLDKSRTQCSDEKQNYGLGLSLAKKIADIHKTEINVSSKNNQTTFYFKLHKS